MAEVSGGESVHADTSSCLGGEGMMTMTGGRADGNERH